MFWRRFLDGHPRYLARHYWWAYLWPPAVWFFDHEPIINAILFGQYETLLTSALSACTEAEAPGPFLQLSCVYGSLTPRLLMATHKDIHIADVAMVQLKRARRKARDIGDAKLFPARMNAENLAYRDGAFGTVLLFFLLHELPDAARRNVLREAVRVLGAGGHVIVADYGRLPSAHWLYRLGPCRRLLTRLEPFLGDFWRFDLERALRLEAQAQGKTVWRTQAHCVFGGFYRIVRFVVGDPRATTGEIDSGEPIMLAGYKSR